MRKRAGANALIKLGSGKNWESFRHFVKLAPCSTSVKWFSRPELLSLQNLIDCGP